MKKLTIFQRLALGFLAILLVFAAIGGYSIVKLRQLNQIIHSISSVDQEHIQISSRLRDAILTQRKFDKMYIVTKDRDFYRQFQETEKYIHEDLSELTRIPTDSETSKRIHRMKDAYLSYLSVAKEEARCLRSHIEYASETYEKAKGMFSERALDLLDHFILTAEHTIQNKIDMSGKIGAQTSRIVAILTLISIAMGLMIAFFNARTINRPILSLIKGTKNIAKGHFDEYLTLPSPPEIHELAQAFNHMCDRLQELDEMKADLISHISHEFRTPLAIIREAASLQRDCISTGSVEKQQRLLTIIEEECERLITSATKILNLSRMDAGMMDYHLEKCSLPPLIEACTSKITPILENNRMTIHVNMESDLPYAVIDAEKMGQVLDNLLDNALKFTPEGGEIFLKASLQDEKSSTHPSKRHPRFIEISISDTGCGIPEAYIPDVFDKFKKLHEKGTGLGLYIAKQIISAHGGDLWVSSKVHEGSTFFFTVPVS
jgi:two-component system, NtrC family, sensor histidine kinase GlrK